MKINFAALSADERATQFAGMDNAALTASLAEARTEAAALFALGDKATITDVDNAEALVASMGLIEAEQNARAAAVKDAADRFAAAKATFAAEDESEEDEEKDKPFSVDAPEEDAETDAEADATDAEADATDAEADAADAGEGDAAVTTAAAVDHTKSQRLPAGAAARAVGQKAKRPNVAATNQVVITAAADVQGFSTGQRLTGMAEVAKAVQARVKGFSPFNAHAGKRNYQESGGAPMLQKFGAASFAVTDTHALTASSGTEREYEAVGEAVKAHKERVVASMGHNGPTAMAAAMAWCSPSEVVYNWIADFVVDGLLDLPEINAPRGGLMLTEGPQLLQTEYGTGAAIDGFGFGGTEAEMEAGYVKTCETIVCPEFFDHRLDFDGYCWKIPILTEKTFPELVTDAMRVSDVAYAHKMNRRFIADVIAESTAIDALNAFGGVQIDTLEAFTQVATKERRWWNLGENAVMEVKLPQEARVIFQFDMARRSGLALNDIATEQKVAAHFAAYNLSVEYLSDFDQRYGSATPTADWPETIRGIMYPVGAFVKAQDDVINLSAVYDAASLSQNEYTGVFYEQGVKVIKRGYRSHVIEVPVCVAGRTGANDLTCTGFEVPGFDGSF